MLKVLIVLMIYLMKLVFQKKTKDLNLSAFNMIIGINESKTVKKHISCERKRKFDGTKCTSNQWRNNEKC